MQNKQFLPSFRKVEVIPIMSTSRGLEEEYAHFLRLEYCFLISLSIVLAGMMMWIILIQLEDGFKYGIWFFSMSIVMEMFVLFFIYGNVWILRNDGSFS